MKELLSPAGDLDSLYAAINGGCDAVYVGMKQFGARKYASNFTKDEIIEATKICHLYGVRIYVTLNTIIKDNEVSSFLNTVDFLYNIGVDAFIMQDFGMINLVLQMYPDIEIHASTQFNNSNIETIKLLKDLGVKRVVLARELSIEEINSINIDIEKEVFIHGALCISYSGCCLFSSMLGSRSGNRGECSGCCRLYYDLYDYDKDTLIKSGYLLSTKELNTSSKFDDLLKSDIKSFKIEGRMKSPEYVYFVTKFYRNIIDGKGYDNIDTDIIKVLYNRKFTTGNLFNDNIMNVKTSNHLGLKIGKVISIESDKIKIKLDKNRKLHQEDGIRFSKSKKGMIVNFLYDKNKMLVNEISDICYVNNNFLVNKEEDVYLTSSKYLSNYLLNYEGRKVPIDIYFEGKIGKEVHIKISDGINKVSISKDICSIAINKALCKEDIINKLKKLGNTVYKDRSISIDIDDNIFIPIKELNELRREATNKLDILRTKITRKGRQKVKFSKLDIMSTSYNTIIIDNEEDLKKVKLYDRIYTKNFYLFNKYKKNKNIYYIEERNILKSKLLSNTLVGEYKYPNNSISDYKFNVTNIYSVYYLLKLGYSCVTLSVELDLEEINSLINNFYKKFLFYPNIEVLVLDKIELMIIKGNILNIVKNKSYYLLDKRKRKFETYFDGNFTHILDCKITKINPSFKCNKRYNIKYLK